MYAVVGCSECQSLWIVHGRPETTSCPRCGSRHQFDRLRKFVTTEEKGEAMEVRAAMLASQQGKGAAYEDLESLGDMEGILEDVGIDDGEFLAAKGVDPEAVSAAGDAVTAGRPRKSRRERVLDALRELEEPTEEGIIAYATDRGVPRAYVTSALEKLSRQGEITRTEDGFRLV